MQEPSRVGDSGERQRARILQFARLNAPVWSELDLWHKRRVRGPRPNPGLSPASLVTRKRHARKGVSPLGRILDL
jgi:hypothetical protein